MLFFLFMIAQVSIVAEIVSGIAGYNLHDKRRVESVGEYIANFIASLIMAGIGVGFIALYVKLFGWPEPD